ncbi:MAG: DUF192 domain-containing protein [Chloroflexi bacterium]|nr:DUF192 domain-containing protein [Chloroflexota bacterium]
MGSGLRAVNRTRNAVLVENGAVAASAWARLRGLLGHRPLQAGEGLLLRGEKAIHTIGMGFPIDVLFLDRAGRIVQLYHSMVPLRVSPYVFRAADVLELPSGILEKTGTVLGDHIEIVNQ